jgi:hypothetical protein
MFDTRTVMEHRNGGALEDRETESSAELQGQQKRCSWPHSQRNAGDLSPWEVNGPGFFALFMFNNAFPQSS